MDDDTHRNLRPLRSDDAEPVLRAFQSNPDMARQGQVETLTQARDYVDRLCASEGPHWPWALDLADHLVGLVAVSIDEENANGWVFYWMTDQARGHGWTKRAVATVANWALQEGKLFRLELGHRVNNPASGAVARAAGFRKEGTQRAKFLVDGSRIDVDIYARLAEDPWPAFKPVAMRPDA